MSAVRYSLNGRSITEEEVKQIQREVERKAMEEKTALLAEHKQKTPPPPRFAEPARRAPQHMRVSMR
ncbi:MAG: hypothetical protein Q8R17_01615 [bacterium]|nr:hypothetical protein [bacterium]